MGRWTEQGERLVQDVANRNGASYDAVSAMLDSILRGNGTMAQFNIPELGGSGQWMRGGMTMVGDMFNYQLKSKVDNICSELSSAIVDRGMQVVPPAVSTHSGGQSGPGGNSWWPPELGSPNSSGSQNQYRYAYFSNARRLAISDGQHVTVYDTLDHRIGGVSQQQGSNTGVCFTSQYGTVDLRTLPLVSGPALGASLASPSSTFSPSASSVSGVSTPAATPANQAETARLNASEASGNQVGPNSREDLLSIIERLAKLRDAGALTDDEFQAKKTDLLSRL